MKLLAAAAATGLVVFVTFPMLMTGGDPPPLPASCLAAADPTSIDPILATIRDRESGRDYQADAPGSTASGAYQFTDSTWDQYGGYARAALARQEVQDAKATEHVLGILEAHNGDITAVPVVWYLGYLPEPDDAAWDTVPAPSAGNQLTPREYQTHWLDTYEQQTNDGVDSSCPETAELSDGWALPGPLDLFASAPLDNPHHDYPAWDWAVPEGTPIYAIRGGEVLTTHTWPHNCFEHDDGCTPCGTGATIADDDDTHWTYCHGSALHVDAGDNITAGTQILTSGNTGRSTGPHLHLAVRTPDNQLRCPQPLLQSLHDTSHGIDPTDLPTTGCTY